jgi:transposase
LIDFRAKEPSAVYIERMQPRINPSDLSSEQKDALIMQLFDHIAVLTDRVKELESQRSKNSRNSSKPPSSDGYDKPKSKPKNSRKKSDKPSGGQPGHKGQTLDQVDEPDHVIEHTIGQCTQCGLDLSTVPVSDIEKRQVFDIPPPPKVQVTEHRAQIKSCPCCASRNKAAFPLQVTQPVQYGKRTQAIVTYLNQYQLLPYKRLQEYLWDVHGLKLSQGTVKNILKRAHDHLEDFSSIAKKAVVGSDVVHFDETGMRVMQSLHWFHVASTQTITCYFIHPRRGTPAMKDIGILDGFEGYAVHDHYSSYYQFDLYHVACNAHQLRELIHAYEENQQQWACKMISCLLEAKAEVEQVIQNGQSSLSDERVSYYDKRYSRILREARKELPVLAAPKHIKPGRKAQHKVKNLHDRLIKHKHETIAFIVDLSVPFDNNQGERDIRMSKTKQKISGCFRSFEGAEHFCRIRAYISTARKQGRNIYDVLCDAFSAEAFDPRAG